MCALPLIGLVKIYQRCISPFTPASCRFVPTCSQYALEA
ncbi:MAG: membrane protein insertion efficiency factor YidD, partial [Alistipes sp.]